MSENILSVNQILSAEIIKTIVQHSENNYYLKIALTSKLRDLLSCRLVVFIQYDLAPSEQEVITIEFSPETMSKKQLETDIKDNYVFLKNISDCTEFNISLKSYPSFSKFSQCIAIPMKHNELLLGTLLLFDLSPLFSINVIFEALKTVTPYISTVLFNALSYNQMENFVEARTKELRKTIDELNKSNQSKSLFLANMSHEMRTPLNGMLGFLELLRLMEEDETKLNYINKIDHASQSLLHLISEVLDLSKIDHDTIELHESNFDLQRTINEIIDLHFKNAQSKGLSFKIHTKDIPKIKVFGDEERFKQILNNLLSNAIKFTQEGNIEVNIECNHEFLRIDHEIIDSRLKFNCDVIDTGKGIHEKNINKIFEVFTQEDVPNTQNFGGTGLGLAIAQRLVALMDGEIHVESVLGSGSVFSFFVYFQYDPLYDNDFSSTGTVIQPAQNYSYEQIKILVVEDNALNSELVKEMLKLKNIAADYAINGREAVDKAALKPYDIIFMDCQMPVMDGFDATKEIRRIVNNSSGPVLDPYIIAITAAVSETDRKKCFDAGMNDFITKPINIRELFNKISAFGIKTS